jgi:hypothetical protein
MDTVDGASRPFFTRFSPRGIGVGDDGDEDAPTASTFTFSGDEPELLLPAASVAVAVKL